MTKTQTNNLNKYFKMLEKEEKNKIKNFDVVYFLQNDKITRFKNIYKLKNEKFKRIDQWHKMSQNEQKEYILQWITKYYKNETETIKNKINDILTCDEELQKIEISVKWSNNKTWGWNPHAIAWVNNKYVGEASASGCGYCKRSTVYSNSLKNSKTFKKAVLLEVLKNKNSLPYGVRLDKWGFTCDFAGCGVSTFTNILKYIGFNYKNISDTENYYIAFK